MLFFFYINFFFLKKKIISCILKGISPFKMHTILFFSRKPEQILGYNSKFRYDRVNLDTGIFIWPKETQPLCH